MGKRGKGHRCPQMRCLCVPESQDAPRVPTRSKPCRVEMRTMPISQHTIQTTHVPNVHLVGTWQQNLSTRRQTVSPPCPTTTHPNHRTANTHLHKWKVTFTFSLGKFQTAMDRDDRQTKSPDAVFMGPSLQYFIASSSMEQVPEHLFPAELLHLQPPTWIWGCLRV